MSQREPEVSIVVATYNRKEPLARLLATLAEQSAPRESYEVVVVDDGSREDPTDVVMSFAPRMHVVLVRQSNTGVALARQNGVERSRGRIIVFLDDDMLVRPDFVAQQILAHEGRDDRVVMGELLPDEGLASMPLFERFHAYQLERMAEAFSARGTFAGHEVYTGNLSLPRALFFRVGGFDPAFWIEDVELGVRLERAGAELVFSRLVATVHASDHTSMDKWLARSIKDGSDWVKLIRKHPDAHAANPWRHLWTSNPLVRPFFFAAVLAPRAGPLLARLAVRGAAGADKLGLERATASAMTLVYGIQYYVGVRNETGSLRHALADLRAYKKERARA